MRSRGEDVEATPWFDNGRLRFGSMPERLSVRPSMNSNLPRLDDAEATTPKWLRGDSIVAGGGIRFHVKLLIGKKTLPNLRYRCSQLFLIRDSASEDAVIRSHAISSRRRKSGA